MRVPLLALAGSLLVVPPPPSAAQSASRDWRPSERTIIGDFSRINAIATSFERVYVASPTSVLVWQPQFRRWEGTYTPPDPRLLNGVFTALVDPSVWLAGSDGWVRFQPELEVWDLGRVGEGVRSIAFDQDDPISGLYILTRSGWQVLPRGALVPSPARPPARPSRPTSVEELLRSTPTLQANAAQVLLDDQQRPVRYTAAARAVDNSGWFLGTSGVGLLFLPDGAAIPQRIPFGLPAPTVGAVLSWPGGVWAATHRTPQAEAALTFVGEELDQFKTIRGLRATGVPFTRVAALAGHGRTVYAATDYGLARVDPREERYEIL